MIRRLVHEEEPARDQRLPLPQDRGSLFIVEAYLQPEASYAEAERALRDCVRELAEAALEEEVAIAKGIETDRLWELESLLSRAELIQDYLHHPEQGPSLSWDLERYRAVTLERLQAAVQEWLIQDPGVVLEVEPLRKSGWQSDPLRLDAPHGLRDPSRRA